MEKNEISENPENPIDKKVFAAWEKYPNRVRAPMDENMMIFRFGCWILIPSNPKISIKISCRHTKIEIFSFAGAKNRFGYFSHAANSFL